MVNYPPDRPDKRQRCFFLLNYVKSMMDFNLLGLDEKRREKKNGKPVGISGNSAFWRYNEYKISIIVSLKKNK